MAPNSSTVMKKFIHKYLDKECFHTIEGGVDVAVKLNQAKLDLICFTGSTFVGKIIAATAAKNLTPCILELGGKCPAVIDESVDIDFAAGKLVGSKFGNSGQTCVAPDYLLVHESKLNELMETM